MARKTRSSASAMGVLCAVILTAILFLFLNEIDPGRPVNLPADPKSVHSETMESGADFAVYMLDVGQGDCALIKSVDGTVLIDAANNGDGELILGNLKELGIDSLDYVIATHPHADHIGAMDEVLQEIPANHVIMPEIPDTIVPTSRSYESLIEKVLEKNIPVIKAVPGKEIEMGAVAIDILAPQRDYDDLNNMSVVIKVTYQGYSFLFTGDAEKESERELLEKGEDISAQVIKVAHHGSKTGTEREFLEQVSPQIALISCGEGNKYGHPHQETIDLLNEMGVEIYRTDQNGWICVYVDEQGLKVMTER